MREYNKQVNMEGTRSNRRDSSSYFPGNKHSQLQYTLLAKRAALSFRKNKIKIFLKVTLSSVVIVGHPDTSQFILIGFSLTSLIGFPTDFYSLTNILPLFRLRFLIPPLSSLTLNEKQSYNVENTIPQENELKCQNSHLV